MKTIKFYDIANKIKELEFDGDKTDLRLHHIDVFSWGGQTEEVYNECEKKIRDFKKKGNGYTVYMWCDISGFEYWMKTQEEQNYIQITVAFDKNEIKECDLSQLEEDLREAYQYSSNLGWEYDFYPSKLEI